MNQFFNNLSILLDAELLNDNQRNELLKLGYIKDMYFYGTGYDASPLIC